MLDLFGFGRRGRRGNGTPPPTMPRHAIHPGWPESTQSVTVNRSDGAGDMVLRLRPLVRGDFQDWQDMRIADQHILQPVEPTVMGDWEDAHSKRQWWQQLLQLRSAADAGTVVPLAIEVNGHFAGQLTLGAIQHGVGSDCWVGYWVHSALSGQGVATAAVALGVDHALQRVGVHRVVATYLPSNTASGRVLEKNGFRQEGYLHRNLHIDGRWQDHYLVALCDDDYSLSCIERLRHKGQVV